jgi:hypothetical protein
LRDLGYVEGRHFEMETAMLTVISIAYCRSR